MDKVPKTTFINSKETEAERIIYTSAQIKREFYYKNRFAVLPKLPPKYHSVVVLPDLAYKSIPNYWVRIDSCEIDTLTSNSDSELIGEVSELFEFEKIDMSQKQSEWESISESVWKHLYDLYPDARDLIDSVEVRLTRYGTTCSWGLLKNSAPQKFICYLREDIPVDHIAEAFFTTMVRWSSSYTIDNWEESEIFIDYLLSTTRLKSVLTRFKPTISSYQANFVHFKSETDAYMSHLGLNFIRPKFVTNSERITLNGVDVVSKFTSGELILLRLLVSKIDSIVGYDELFASLWGDDVSKHSLWALSRIVSRMRKKLVDLGFSSHTIHAVYGRGYIFINS